MTFPGSGAKFTLQLSAKLAFYLVLLPAPAFVLTVPLTQPDGELSGVLDLSPSFTGWSPLPLDIYSHLQSVF